MIFTTVMIGEKIAHFTLKFIITDNIFKLD